ncbi:MAG: ABC transporter ATP-binding protein [Deltaproteobacteria bacterium]|nr:ABC transporter ATP-binding protein [Deltaproteobacteria bacterium]
MLNLREISKTYTGTRSLTDVSFAVPENSITGIIGPNGAGKSTLLKIIAGFEHPDSGEMLFRGTPLSAFDDIKRLVSYMPEQLEIYPDYRVSEFLGFLHGTVGRADVGLLELLNLMSVRNKKIGHLSKGYRQRLKLYFSLCNDKRIVILDEPFDGFDPIQLQDILDMIRAENRKERTFIISIHQLHDAEKICTRYVLLKEGSLVAEGDMASLAERFGLEEPSLEQVFMEALL